MVAHSIVCGAEQRRNDIKNSKKMATTRTPEQLGTEKATEIGKVTAKAATLIESAKETLKNRLIEEEDAKKKPADMRDAAMELATQASAQARAVLNAEELKVSNAIKAVEAKWTPLIEVATAAKAKAEALEKEAKEKEEKALKRRADLTAQAERRVQQDTIANAAKRPRPAANGDISRWRWRTRTHASPRVRQPVHTQRTQRTALVSCRLQASPPSLPPPRPRRSTRRTSLCRSRRRPRAA